MFCLITPPWHFAFLNPEQFLPLYYLYVRLAVSFSYNYYVIISNEYSNSLFLCPPTQLKTWFFALGILSYASPSSINIYINQTSCTYLLTFEWYTFLTTDCRGADQSLARPGRKQANVSVIMARISFGSLPCRKRNFMTARVSILLKLRASLTCFRASFIPGRAKDLSAPRYSYFK